MKKLLLALLIPTLCYAADELYMPNEAGGFVTLTKEVCANQNIKKTFPYKATATEGNGTLYEGCWAAPDQKGSGAPQGASPIVSLMFEEGAVYSYKIDLFSYEKKRWDDSFTAPTVVVTPKD